MSILDDLQKRGLIEAVEPDLATAAGWLDDAGRHLDAAIKIAELDPSGADVLAYDAARKSVAGALLISATGSSAGQDRTRLSPSMPIHWRRKRASRL